MVTGKISSKGQITIPQEVRVRLGLREGDRVEFVLENGNTILRPAPAGKDVFETYTGALPHFKSRKEINDWISELRDDDSGE